MSDTSIEAQKRFGANVDDSRRRLGLSIEQLAERSKLDRDDLVKILNGEDEARASTVHRLAGALGVDPGDLFGGMRWVSPADGGTGYEIEERPDA
jgi:transcriptional regulator with XRE-family HTH domain